MTSRPFILGALVLVTAACGAEMDDPIQERLRAIADPEATEPVAKMLRALGGHEAWFSKRNAEYVYQLSLFDGESSPQLVTRQIHRLGLGTEVQAYVEDLDGRPLQIVRLNDDELEVISDGVRVDDADFVALPRAYTRIGRWRFRTPWNLIDPQARLESRGVRTPKRSSSIPPIACDVVRLTFFESNPVGGIDDWHDFYISRSSHLVEQVHSYRAQDDSYRVSIWSEYRNVDGVRIAHRRETHLSDKRGNIGALQAIAEYADVHFDAPFGSDIFRPTMPPAASTAGE